MTVMNAWGDTAERRLIRTAMRAEMLARDDELALARAWRDHSDEAALSRLTAAYLRLVVAMASKFKHYGISLGDLIQEGTVGLLEAAARFEPDRELRFSTYASWWIRASIQDFVLRNWSIVRTGTTSAHKALFFNLRRLKSELGLPADKPLSLKGRQAIASEMGVREVDVSLMEGRLTGNDKSLNATVADDTTMEWQDLLPSDGPTPDIETASRIDAGKRRALIEEAMNSLNQREILIIRERHLSEDAVTLSSLANRLGVSKERVRQLEAQALNKLKKTLANRVDCIAAAGLIDD